MHCPFCSSGDTRVVDSRLGDGGENVRRRRKCLTCSQRFTTVEQVVFEMPWVIKSNGRREKFDEEKLRSGITRALEKRPIEAESVEAAINRIMNQFTGKGDQEVDTKQIGGAVMDALRQLDEVAYLRFASVYESFQNPKAFSDEVEKLKASLPSKDSKFQASLLPNGESER